VWLIVAALCSHCVYWTALYCITTTCYGLFILLYTGSDFRWALLERSGSREGFEIHRCQLVREMSGTVLPLAGAHVCHGDGEATWDQQVSLSLLRNSIQVMCAAECRHRYFNWPRDLEDLSSVTGNHQCGFRRNRSTTDQIFYILQRLMDKWEYTETVHQLSIDFKKDSDSVRSEVLYSILSHVFKWNLCHIHTGGHTSDQFPIQNSLEQGDSSLSQF
jgi:hypothetical protein